MSQSEKPCANAMDKKPLEFEFVQKHVWIPASREREFTEFVEGLRAHGRKPHLPDILAALRNKRDYLEQRGLEKVFVFGSVARGEAGPASDLDLAVTFSPTSDIGLIGFMGLEREMSEMVDLPVQMTVLSEKRQEFNDRIQPDLVQVF